MHLQISGFDPEAENSLVGTSLVAGSGLLSTDSPHPHPHPSSELINFEKGQTEGHGRQNSFLPELAQVGNQQNSFSAVNIYGA